MTILLRVSYITVNNLTIASIQYLTIQYVCRFFHMTTKKNFVSPLLTLYYCHVYCYYSLRRGNRCAMTLLLYPYFYCWILVLARTPSTSGASMAVQQAKLKGWTGSISG